MPGTTEVTSARVYMSDEVRDDYRTYAEFRTQFGFVHRNGVVKILTQPTDNSKLDKSALPTWGLSLAPHTIARDYCRLHGIQSGYSVPDQCPHATVECSANCLQANGNGRYESAQLGRICKTVFAHTHPEAFARIVEHEVRSNLATTLGECLHRLNVLSDRRWEVLLPRVFTLRDPLGRLARFYDYSKIPPLVRERNRPTNYHLTYSATEHTTVDAIRSMVDAGHSVAVVIRAKASELNVSTWNGMDATNGDLHDDRTQDDAGVVLLSAKGTMRRSPMAKELATA